MAVRDRARLGPAVFKASTFNDCAVDEDADADGRIHMESSSVDWGPSLRTARAKGPERRDPSVSPCSALGLCRAVSQVSENEEARAF